MKRIWIILITILSVPAFTQSLFEDAVADASSQDMMDGGTHYELNGFMRGIFYGGKIPDEAKAELKSAYGEAALKFRVRKKQFGDGFAEIRFRRGTEFGLSVEDVVLREAYVNAYVGCFDFRIGHQIVVWGRADGFNPTNNITPQNMLVRSPDEDDMREGNFLIRSNVNLTPIRLEFVWVPVYAASVLPIHIIPMPLDIEVEEMEMPSADLENSGFAVKANLELASLDGSVSYFHGFGPMPGVHGEIQGINIIARPEPYRIHVLGADFSTTAGSVGLRGEFAYREPEDDYTLYPHIPNPDVQVVLGLDKTWGDFNLILQYIGRFVRDFTELEEPESPLDQMAYELEHKNRMIASQLYELSHATSFRPSWTLLHEIMTIELSGLYNFTTEELLLRPKLSYDIADALSLTVGGDVYHGPDETLFGVVDETLSSVYMELRASF